MTPDTKHVFRAKISRANTADISLNFSRLLWSLTPERDSLGSERPEETAEIQAMQTCTVYFYGIRAEFIILDGLIQCIWLRRV